MSDEPPADRSTGQGHRRVRGVAFRVVLVFFALVWLTLGFGVIDFVSGFTSVNDRDPLGIGVLSVCIRPSRGASEGHGAQPRLSGA